LKENIKLEMMGQKLSEEEKEEKATQEAIK
jgi:hypothetical protein